jgi:hypothetical protein
MKKLHLGSKFNRLTIIEIMGDWRKRQVRVRCDCGAEKVMWWANVVSGKSASCGCFHAEQTAAACVTHGMTRGGKKYPGLYVSWAAMKQRCLNPLNPAFENYGGRGVAICERWLKSFENFFDDMAATWFKGATIEREDVNGDYCPENCKWIKRSEQNKNTRVTKRAARLSAEIKRLRSEGFTSSEIAERIGLSASGVKYHFRVLPR